MASRKAPNTSTSLSKPASAGPAYNPEIVDSIRSGIIRFPKQGKRKALLQIPDQPPARWLLRLSLEKVEPVVWREFVVSNACTLDRLNEIALDVMGWNNTHLHRWHIGSLVYGNLEVDDDDPKLIDEVGVRLRNLPLGRGSTFFHEYDFGDGWRHRLELLDIQSAMKGGGNPVVTGGANCCPPEDCGGPWGYAEFLKAISDPNHPEHASKLRWCGGKFDPKAFDLEKVQLALRFRAHQHRYLGPSV